MIRSLSALKAIILYQWKPRMGDPSLSGWVITIAYFCSFVLCITNGLLFRSSERRATSSQRARLWYIFSGIMLVFGVNKQLDLQTLLTQVGSRLSQAQGWYELRRAVQLLFIVVLFVVFVLFIVYTLKKLRDNWRHFTVTPFGILTVLVWVMVRAALMQHVDSIIFHTYVHGHRRVNHLIEFGGIVLTGLGALIALLRSRKKRDMISGSTGRSQVKKSGKEKNRSFHRSSGNVSKSCESRLP
jgi:hypothetical protein